MDLAHLIGYRLVDVLYCCGDLDEAKIEWARLDLKAIPKPAQLMGRLFDDYESTLKPGTQRDYQRVLSSFGKHSNQPRSRLFHPRCSLRIVTPVRRANETGLCIFINGLLDLRTQATTTTSILITNQAGLRTSYNMLRDRWDDVREKAANKAVTQGDTELAITIRNFQFRDIRPKAATEINDLNDASRLLGHSTEEMTKNVYRRVGEIVKSTRQACIGSSKRLANNCRSDRRQYMIH